MTIRTIEPAPLFLGIFSPARYPESHFDIILRHESPRTLRATAPPDASRRPPEDRAPFRLAEELSLARHTL